VQNSILITGGTGSFGREFVKTLLNLEKPPSRIVVFSRDELKQWEMAQIFPEHKYPNLRFFLGDVRDQNRLKRALKGIDTVVHAAALKQVPAAEYNPIEFINTNVIGAENVVQSCLDTSVKRVVALSTDKAAAPINLYGATKLCSDKLFIAANNIKGWSDIRFSVVRYGNVMGSRGSVIPFFMERAASGTLPITHESMTRFNISLKEGVNMVLWALDNCIGGEILVPRIPSYRIMDVAEAIGPSCERKIVGIRPGEKIHEEMITQTDGSLTIGVDKYYAILPPDRIYTDGYRAKGLKVQSVEKDFSYRSDTNPDFLSVQEIREEIRKNICSTFLPI